MSGWDRRNTSGRDAGWDRIRRRIMRRDKNSCRFQRDGLVCGNEAAIVDHIVPKFEGGSDDDSNLMALCQFHSDQKTAAEGVRARVAKTAAVRKRWDRREAHPGLI